MSSRVRIKVNGIVQGVGFRPHVYNLALSRNLAGFVLNTSMGVLIEVEGPGADTFAEELRRDAPPLARIETLQSEKIPPAGGRDFEIRMSEPAEGEFALVSPDIATCPDCLRELYDKNDRRHLYPFINCTNCGPRYSIVTDVPYDRPYTTMRAFKMCPACETEYRDPADRRFHAQPVACRACGPEVKYLGKDKGALTGDDAVVETINALKEGLIVAMKGLGGYQLVCDAGNHEAVKELRQKKRRNRKPFALMSGSIETIETLCHVSGEERLLLSSRARPIVLLLKKPGVDDKISTDVAPGNNRLGFMLPYTPLHHLLFHHPGAEGAPGVLVMTSGNISEEPIVIDNHEAIGKLSALSDCFLMHDRDIHMRVDDSVVRMATGVPRIIRRARGYVPETIDMGRKIPEILACGGDLKNTLCIIKDSYAIMSQHIGDLGNHEAMVFFAETLENLKRIFHADPVIVAHDLHPDYFSTRFAIGYKPAGRTPELVAVQHHHAHISACMAENGFNGKVIGVAFDGTGYGTDGNMWGSEFLLADYSGFRRFAHLNYTPLPGGDTAIKEPWRAAFSFLVQAFRKEGVTIFSKIKPGACNEKEVNLISTMLEKGINSPLSCGMGRLFDAVSSLVGLRDKITFEGEAAIALEMAAYEFRGYNGTYPYSFLSPRNRIDDDNIVDTTTLICAIVYDIIRGAPAGEVAIKFHNTIAEMVVRMSALAREETGLEVVALSGGVFQNALLLELVEAGLATQGFNVLTHSRVPFNDGCVSLGQAAVAAARHELSHNRV